MKLTRIITGPTKIITLCVVSFFTLHSYAQNAGDEDKEMFNHAKARDEKAIKEAVDGWWTASMKGHANRIQWWKDAKFGMFVHWGIYSLPGGEWKGKEVSGYAEHLMRKEKITRAEYLDLASRFNPVRFNAEEWILTAKRAGMNYFIITAKHHDGFGMYDSKVSDFDIIDQTPFKRDPMAELAAAAKKHGMRFGFYYSHAFDWEHPDAPGNDWEYLNPGGDKLIGGANWFDNHPDWLPKAVKYVHNKAIPQIKELIQRYHPDILWFDTPHKLPFSENLRMLKAIRETDPNIVVNGRLARTAGMNFGDYTNTGDRPAEFRSPTPAYWEAVPTTNESYGYSKYDLSHKTGKFFIQLLAKAASRGGNILANLGPLGDGSFDTKDTRIFDSVGKWIDKNRASVFNTGSSVLPIPAWGVSTTSGNKIYLHVFNWPKDGKLQVGGLKSSVKKAYLFTDPAKKPLTITRRGASDLSIAVPSKSPDEANAVIVLDVKGKIAVDSVRRLDPQIVNRLLVFDAEPQGQGFSFGDGKAMRYNVERWTSPDQYFTWDLHSLNPVSYKVVLKYLRDEKTGGTYHVQLNNFSKKGTIQQTKNDVVTQEIGIAKVNAGRNQLSIKAEDIAKGGFIKLLEIQLIPVTNQ